MSNTKPDTTKETVDKEINPQLEAVSKEIEEVLLRNKFALQPFMAFSEYGIVARVRLVGVGNTKDNEQNTNQGKTKPVSEPAGATESK